LVQLSVHTYEEDPDDRMNERTNDLAKASY